jgi:hypothetical protein
MKCLSIQIQADRCGEENPQEVVLRLQCFCSQLACVTDVDVSKGEGYVNINCTTEDLATLWAHLKKDLYECDSVLQNASIVLSEGDSGWDDYLLLHHYDENEELDSV